MILRDLDYLEVHWQELLLHWRKDDQADIVYKMFSSFYRYIYCGIDFGSDPYTAVHIRSSEEAFGPKLSPTGTENFCCLQP